MVINLDRCSMRNLRACLCAWLLASVLWPPPAAAVAADTAQAPASADAAQDADIQGAPVLLDGRVLFTVRGSSSVPAAARAAAISERVEAVARDSAVNPDDIKVVTTPLGEDVDAGETRIMRVLPSDGVFESMPYAAVADYHARRLRQALTTYRAERQPQALVHGILVSMVATASMIIALWLTALVFRRLNALLAKSHTGVIKSAPQERTSETEQILWRPVEGLVLGTHWLLRLTLIFLWLHVVLGQFPPTRWLSDNLSRFIVAPVVDIGYGVVDYLPKLIFLLVLFVVTRYALRMLHFYFGALERGTLQLRGFEPEWAMPTYKLIRAAVIGLALIMGYPYLPGAGTDALKGLSLFVGLLFSFGASTAVSGVISGYINTFGRVFKVGDVIKVGEMLGTVTKVGLVTTRIRSIRNEEVTIPNSTITSNSLINYSALARARGLILQTEVGIGYEVSWRQVHAMLLEAARRTPEFLSSPAPFVLQRQLGDFAVVYQLNVFKSSAENMVGARSALHQNVLDVFNEYGVQIMTPAYESDPQIPKVVAKEQWYPPPAGSP